jgi:dTDP-glucose pyrophosphorylase
MNKVNILLPIAGHGNRFAEKGYELPKPLIQVEDKIIVEKSLDSINYADHQLIFVVRQEHVTRHSIDSVLYSKFGKDIKIIVVEYDTDGAICTCLLAEKFIDTNDPLVIFTPDCFFEPQFDPGLVDQNLDGVVSVFSSSSDDHSYVILDSKGYAIKTAEKQVISENAVGGLYYFKKGCDFVRNAKAMIQDNNKTKGEFYICPVYNYLIQELEAKVGIFPNNRHVVLGTPEGLESYLRGEQ